MLSTEFKLYFKSLNDFYLGCFSADNYPKSLNNNEFFIVNKDKSYEKGSHWRLVLLINNEIQFFDSCGSTEEVVQSFLQFHRSFVCVFNETPVQPLNSTTCGEFCIYFAFKRLQNKDLSFKSCINAVFSSDLNKNNDKVKKLCTNIYENVNNKNI